MSQSLNRPFLVRTSGGAGGAEDAKYSMIRIIEAKICCGHFLLNMKPDFFSRTIRANLVPKVMRYLKVVFAIASSNQKRRFFIFNN